MNFLAKVVRASNRDDRVAQQTPEDKRAGEVAVDILASEVFVDQSAGLHHSVMSRLQARGFRVIPEFHRRALGDPGNRRIDIVAILEEGRVAIELDCRRPRRKSLEKLRLYPGSRIVGLRGVLPLIPNGIDACVSMSVRQPTKTEQADKRIYRPPHTCHDDWTA